MVVGKRVREGDWYRERQFEPSECQPGTFRNISLGKDNRGIVCRKKGSKKTSLQSKLTPVKQHRRKGRTVRKHMRRVR